MNIQEKTLLIYFELTLIFKQAKTEEHSFLYKIRMMHEMFSLLIPFLLVLLKTGESSLVYPNIIDKSGQFLTNRLEDFDSFVTNGVINYEIELNKHKLEINLELNTNLFRDVSFEKTRKKCHFQGLIKQQEHSLVALSICKGLVSTNSSDDEIITHKKCWCIYKFFI